MRINNQNEINILLISLYMIIVRNQTSIYISFSLIEKLSKYPK